MRIIAQFSPLEKKFSCEQKIAVPFDSVWPWSVPEVDLDVEEYEGDKGRDSEDDGEGQVHVELDVHRVIP